MIRPIQAEGDIADAYSEPLALIYKHSPTCPISAGARRHVVKFADAHPDVPIFEVDVLTNRPLSRRIESELDIKHESPQAIVVHKGSPVWNASHHRITAEVLAEHTM
ncbi:MAG: bacillithiol system redox-active protein YtxJ [Bacteroidota bacterium]